MKIQLDYDTKTITLEDNVNLGEFFDKIKNILPDFKEWKLETKTVINWNNPITIPYNPYVPNPYPYNPYPWWHYGTDVGTGTVTLKSQPMTYTDVNTCVDGGKITGTSVVDSITSGTYQLEVN